MKQCKYINERGHCTIGASSRGLCTLPCSHLEYERCKFEDLKTTEIFEFKGDAYMRIEDEYVLNTKCFGSSVNLKCGMIYNFPKETEVIPLKCSIDLV